MKVSKEIAYFIYNERPSSNLLVSQVLPLIKRLKEKNPNYKLTLIAFWQFWVQLKYSTELNSLKLELSKNNISLKNYPFALPERHFFAKQYTLKLIVLISSFLAKIIFNRKYTLIHCRGYFSTYITCKSVEESKTKVLFDGRSLYPLENITRGNWTYDDKIYKYWKKIELFNLKKSFVSVGVSMPLVRELQKTHENANVVFIPCSVDTNTFKFSADKRSEIRKQLNIDTNKIVIVYCGSLGLSFWNDINVYINYFKKIKAINKNVLFLLLTGSDLITISNQLKKHFNLNDFKIVNVKHQEVSFWLSASDLGIQVMSPTPDGFSRLGVKLTEYIACGLPVITNSNVGGAISIVEDYDVGSIINLDDENFTANFNQLLRKLKELDKVHYYKVAYDLFSVEKVANQYNSIYRSA